MRRSIYELTFRDLRTWAILSENIGNTTPHKAIHQHITRGKRPWTKYALSYVRQSIGRLREFGLPITSDWGTGYRLENINE